jgi:hypothetical protein
MIPSRGGTAARMTPNGTDVGATVIKMYCIALQLSGLG